MIVHLNKDLGLFAKLVYTNVADTTLKRKAQTLMNAVQQTVLLFKNTGKAFTNSMGLAIYFPEVPYRVRIERQRAQSYG